MKLTWLRNPHNFWGSWVNTPKLHQAGVLLGVSGLILYQPLWNGWNQYSQQIELQQALQHQNEQQIHQQRLLDHFKQRLSRNLTPELAARLPLINEKINSLANKLEVIHSQWHFQVNPTLSLDLQGNFPELRQFLTELLNIGELQLVSCQITQLPSEDKSETQSISSQLVLQLKKET